MSQTTRRKRVSPVHAAVVFFGLLPLLVLAVRASFDELGANPIEEITHETGDWALRFLWLVLAITPIRVILAWQYLAPYRRTFGLFAFFYASLHLSTYVGLDLFFEWDALIEDVLERRFVLAGFTAFLCMLPLAITSTRAWIRYLGRRWEILHRLAYVAGAAAAAHYLWLVKADNFVPLIYTGILAGLFATRFGRFRRQESDRPAKDSTESEPDGEEDDWVEDEPVEMPIEQAIDLHTFRPREIPKVVEAYLEAAADAGFAEVLLIHGNGKGIQRERVQGILAAHPRVKRYEDAPPQRGGWGATLAWLRLDDSSRGAENLD